ncbi:DnaB-like helicase C-terminal domain-containing protein [Streptomyces sp. NPDC056004]|uniref:DnaB-like helicase C-terminal domain-containing protein n=1 Tax=Streptomyces sp. NPDC056004 TaxID=3345677 RepID=UPI0035DD1973
MDSRLGSDEWMAEKKQRASERAKRPLTPWPALDEVLDMELGRKRFAVLALPWESGGETPFHIAQRAAKSGANPLCLFPSWSPHWDGTLDVRRPAELPDEVDYENLASKGGKTGMVIIDQFSRLHWGRATTHAAREEAIENASRDLLSLALRASLPVLVVLRRTKNAGLDIADLRSDGALEYDCDVFATVNPDHESATATLKVAKSRLGPTETTTVAWEVLPRTYYQNSAKTVPHQA